MDKIIYIAVANIDFLGDKCDLFLNGTEDEVWNFCEDNYDRSDNELVIYRLDRFIELLNDDSIDVDGSYFRKFIK